MVEDVDFVELVGVPEVVLPDETEALAWYKDRPFGPPQIWSLSAAQGMLQRPSVTGSEPETRVLPQKHSL